MYLLHQAPSRKQLKQSQEDQGEQMGQERSACAVPQSDESLGLCLMGKIEEFETHKTALKREDFSDSNFTLLAVIGTKDLEFQMKRFSK